MYLCSVCEFRCSPAVLNRFSCGVYFQRIWILFEGGRSLSRFLPHNRSLFDLVDFFDILFSESAFPRTSIAINSIVFLSGVSPLYYKRCKNCTSSVFLNYRQSEPVCFALLSRQIPSLQSRTSHLTFGYNTNAYLYRSGFSFNVSQRPYNARPRQLFWFAGPNLLYICKKNCLREEYDETFRWMLQMSMFLQSLSQLSNCSLFHYCFTT